MHIYTWYVFVTIFLFESFMAGFAWDSHPLRFDQILYRTQADAYRLPTKVFAHTPIQWLIPCGLLPTTAMGDCAPIVLLLNRM